MRHEIRRFFQSQQIVCGNTRCDLKKHSIFNAHAGARKRKHAHTHGNLPRDILKKKKKT